MAVSGPVLWAKPLRSEERRVGKECRIGCRSRWSPSHSKKKTRQHHSYTTRRRSRNRKRTTERWFVLSILRSRGAFPILKIFFFKQKTAYEISECDWSSDVCSSD